mgnify:CR=1 FL=1
MDDDAIFPDMEFTFPFEEYDKAGVNLVIWGDPQRVFRANDIQGLNTGVFLLRKSEWSRQLMAEVAALATPSIRRQIGNKGRIAEQGALTWVLHSQSAKWKGKWQTAIKKVLKSVRATNMFLPSAAAKEKKEQLVHELHVNQRQEEGDAVRVLSLIHI